MHQIALVAKYPPSKILAKVKRVEILVSEQLLVVKQICTTSPKLLIMRCIFIP